MHLFGDSGMFSFVRISISNWIVYVNSTDDKRKRSQVLNNNNS